MFKNAIAALALTATVAQPAAAGNDDLIKGIFAVIVLNEVLKPTQSTTHTVTTVIHTNDHRVCSTEIERLRNGQTLVHELDCRGNVISTRWR